ncbi:enoyl-CoA hydratase/isomerase family protein [Streptomyces prunicolor]|uniref:enoyl-CoA hydratase/isomerase family protein n=1 Tax=Streptomyces prunicolor TaxID=67348 RepID=UPI00036E7CF8|nr:enoyl-CoA hydratase/isomerase family protein [Streptomyces prunicolor]
MMLTRSAISVADLAAGAAHADLLAEGGAVVDPLLLVDLDRPFGSTAVLRRAVERAQECDRLLVGVTRAAAPPAALTEALDLTLVTADGGDRRLVAVEDPDAEARVLHGHALGNPEAAVVLGQVLRVGEHLAVHQALDAESLAYSTLLAGGGFARWLAARGDRPVPPPARAETVLVRRDGDTLHLTLNRPERRNAYGRELRDALVAALDVARLDATVAEVVLDGNGPSFCSGGDLGEFGVAADLSTAHLVRTRGGAARSVHELRDRITVRMHGACVGAGIELPAFASRIVADPGTVFRLPELGMGLIPGAGGTVSIPRRIGRWRTLYLVLSGCPLDAGQALRWGLVDEVEPVRPPVA